MGFNPLGGTNPWRFANCNQSAQNVSGNFSASYCIGAISQDGNWYMFSSDWLGTLGSTSGTAACVITSTCRSDVFIVQLGNGTSAIAPFPPAFLGYTIQENSFTQGASK
jgi:hypothetical protein